MLWKEVFAFLQVKLKVTSPLSKTQIIWDWKTEPVLLKQCHRQDCFISSRPTCLGYKRTYHTFGHRMDYALSLNVNKYVLLSSCTNVYPCFYFFLMLWNWLQWGVGYNEELSLWSFSKRDTSSLKIATSYLALAVETFHYKIHYYFFYWHVFVCLFCWWEHYH